MRRQNPVHQDRIFYRNNVFPMNKKLTQTTITTIIFVNLIKEIVMHQKNTQNIAKYTDYIISQHDFNLLDKYTDNADQNIKKIKEILARYKKTEKEQLTPESCHRILGDLYNNVVYYNHDTEKWNRNFYNGCFIMDQEVDTATAKKLKQALETIPQFSKKYELVANITLIVSKRDFPGYEKWAHNVKHCATGTATVGNLIVRNKSRGRLELWSPAWIGVENCGAQSYCVLRSASWFADSVVLNLSLIHI